MDQITGSLALQIIEGMNEAVTAGGTGEMRGVKGLVKLRELGLDVIVVEKRAPVVPAPAAQD